MLLQVMEMDVIFAEEILSWKYEAPYDFYNNEYSVAAVRELLNHSYFVVVDDLDEIFGYFCMGESAQVPIGSIFGAYPAGFLDIGIGMNPIFTGQGRGQLFLTFILNHIQSQVGTVSLRLTVVAFNTRAIHLYEKHGFEMKKSFRHGDVLFITMVRE
ncbi:GNAT family N-acetyltransferase [Neobacillus sp. MM2021_6]|uniref:GNAT family N-acetyltransferase n=1 Tax=Bacillaceae TaxID=186817 RepID=UPI00140886FE|nr:MULTISPECIES: GNAT family N-acetyltransferase [Bacillaceae]MBO0959289.1 GNAT family N-acetyltransferase [Neobacillus sp. MM2021_6]NHC20604.1 GNAT family N-acetyltransferase [Bacillus sp. MM2020_4]